MELREYIRVVRDRWALILFVVFIGLSVALGVTVLSEKTYESSAKIFIAVRPSAVQANSSTTPFSLSQYVLGRMKSYTELANSNDVLQPVIDATPQLKDKGVTVADLATHVAVTNPASTVLLLVTVSEPSPRLAASIAQNVATELSTNIQSLEGDRSGSHLSPVSALITKQAVVPSTPTSPRPKLNLALGLVGGLAVGLILAILRQQTKAQIGTADDVRQLTGAPPLAVIKAQRSSAREPISAFNDDGAANAEAFRRLYTNLAVLPEGDRPATVVVTAATQNVDRTVTACNIAVAAAQAGVRVCVVEADFRRPTIARLLGVESSRGFAGLLAGYSLESVVRPYRRGLFAVIADASPSNPYRVLAGPNLGQAFASLSERYDLILVDTPPVLTAADALLVARHVDGVVVVARTRHSTRREVGEVLDSLSAIDAHLIGVVLTHGRRSDTRPQEYLPSRRSPRRPQTKRSARAGRRAAKTQLDDAPKRRITDYEPPTAPKGSASKDATSKDATSKDATSKDATSKDAAPTTTAPAELLEVPMDVPTEKPPPAADETEVLGVPTEKPPPAADGTEVLAGVLEVPTDEPGPAADGTEVLAEVLEVPTDEPEPAAERAEVLAEVPTDEPEPAADETEALAEALEVPSDAPAEEPELRNELEVVGDPVAADSDETSPRETVPASVGSASHRVAEDHRSVAPSQKHRNGRRRR